MRMYNNFLFLLSMALASGCDTNTYKQGESLYQSQCANCHMADGSGLGSLIPSLHTSEILKKGSGQELICLIRQGIPKNPQTNQQMLPNLALNTVELTNLTNYLFQEYSESAGDVQLSQVTQWQNACQMGEK